MKRILSTILLCVTTLCAYSQEDITLFFLNDGTFKGFYDEEIDSITYSHLDLDSVWHADAVVQDVWLADSVVRIPIEKIDSICHKVPEPEFKQGTIILDDRYLPYITSVNGLTISFSSSLPENLRPHKGDVLYYKGISDLFPEGFAGKVVSEGNTVTCEQADIPDIYQKFVFFGKYTVVKKDHAGKPSYALRRIKGRPNPDNGIGGGGGDDDDFGIGDGRFPDFTIGSLKEAIEFELKDYNVKIKTSFKVTPVFTIEYAYAFNFFEPLLFFKCKKTVDYETSFSVAYAKDYNQLKDDGFWEKRKGGDIPLSTEAPEMFKKIGIESLSRDKKDRGTVYFIDKKFPIPECPLIQLGAKVGFFITPKLEGELVLGASNKGTYEKTYIYNLDKNNWLHLSDDWRDYLLPWRFYTGKYLEMGDWKCIDGPQTCEPTDWYLDGSVKGSIWAGLVAGASASAGFGENAEVKGEAKFRIGPYAEGEIKLKLLDALSDWNSYSLVKDTHLKMGVKLGVNLAFSAKLKSDFLGSDVGFQWDLIDWTPKKLLWERTWYLLPEFEAPKYTVRGNSLICTTNVSRMTFPNTIGFALFDETGNVKRKYMGATYKNYKADKPFQMSLTFDGLDFANHRYTIVPSSELFTADWLRFDAPDQYRTTVLCPDSRHPHLIDLGLPSGTKWLCQNVSAENPKDAGGYYQWGKPFKVNSYTDHTYKAPNLTMPNYQSSEYDAATANLGQEYCTPTMSQFLELHDNCSMDYKYSPLGNNVLGVFLKGKNGNNLYLPFSGFKSGVKVNNSTEGWFLSSDAVDANNKLQRKAVVIKNNDVIWNSADALAKGHSVRPVSARSGGLVFEPQQLDYEVIVGQKVGQTVTLTNNGSTPVSVTVAQTIAPFHVDDACLGTFTVKPKERLNVLVYFSPTEEVEYTSVLTLSYDTNNACVVSKIPLKGKGINANNIPLTLSETSVSLQKGDRATVTITSGSGQYSVKSNNTSVATATLSGTAITVKGVSKGTATITVTDTKTKQTATIAVTVTEEVTNLTLSESSVSLQKGDRATVTITSGSGQYSVKSNKTSVATASLSGTAITVKGVSKGSATITVTDTKTKQTATIEVLVIDNVEVDGQLFTVNGVSFMMVNVEGGDFTMGATSEQGSDSYSNEKPAHKVIISDFSIAQTEVTQELWQAVMGSNPSEMKDPKRPVENVSWEDCQKFIKKLNALTDTTFRLPTEAEWEYAARGGKKSANYKYAGGNDIDYVAWYRNNSSDETKTVSNRMPNELGLYDMSGNVSEWCQDWFGDYSGNTLTNPTGPDSGEERVIRGGSIGSGARYCRVSYRSSGEPDYSDYDIGLRLALTVPEPPAPPVTYPLHTPSPADGATGIDPGYVNLSCQGYGLEQSGAHNFQYTLSESPDLGKNTRRIRHTLNSREKVDFAWLAGYVGFDNLQSNTKYYWRIEEFDYKNGGWVILSPVWSFTTK